MVEDVEFLREVFEKQSTFLDIIDAYRSSHHLLTILLVKSIKISFVFILYCSGGFKV